MANENNNLFIRAILFILHIVSVIIRGSLYYLFKFLYKVLKLWEFEKTDIVYGVKDDLNHTFSFKRSSKFRKLYSDLLSNLKWYKSSVAIDLHNGTNYSDEILDECIENVDKLIVDAEQEAMKKAFIFSNRRKKGLPYTDNADMELSFYLENIMNGYNDYENNLDNLK